MLVLLPDDNEENRVRLGGSETLRGGRTDVRWDGAGARVRTWMCDWVTVSCRDGGVGILRVLRDDPGISCSCSSIMSSPISILSFSSSSEFNVMTTCERSGSTGCLRHQLTSDT